MSSNTGRQILEQLNSLTLKQDALTAKQTDMSNQLGEVSKDIYNIKIVIAAVGMAAGLMLAASNILSLLTAGTDEVSIINLQVVC